MNHQFFYPFIALQDEDETIESIDDSTINSAYSKREIQVGDDAVTLLYNICEGGLQVLGDVCGLFSTTASDKPLIGDSDDKAEGDSQPPTIEEWFNNSSEVVFYNKEKEPSSSSLCGGGGGDTWDNGKAALLNMSLTAARIQHRLKNLKYDDTQSMNPINDIYFVISHVGIPIGSE